MGIGALLTRGDRAQRGPRTITLEVANTGDRPIQIGSHYHFSETNPALRFDRAARERLPPGYPRGHRRALRAGQTRTVDLVAYAGERIVLGFRGEVMGPLDGA